MDKIMQELSNMYGVDKEEMARQLFEIVLNNKNIVLPKRVKNQPDETGRFLWFLTGVLLGKYSDCETENFDGECARLLKHA